MTTRGEFFTDLMEITGVEGGKYNNTNYLYGNWIVGNDVELAIRGWSYPGENSFKVSLDKNSSNDKQILIMRNSRGVFKWLKK